MAVVLKDRVRIKQFFQDFDRLRKGQVGIAAVSIKNYIESAVIFIDSYFETIPAKSLV